jgi:hypothetical protein
MANTVEHTIIITREQYDNIHRMLLDRSPPLSKNKLPGKPWTYNTFTKELKRIPSEDDVNVFLKGYNGRLGNEIKKYNPYVWRREIIFETEQDATTFVLKEL